MSRRSRPTSSTTAPGSRSRISRRRAGPSPTSASRPAAPNATQQEQAFLAAQAKNPDAFIGLTSSNTFIPVGPKVAATDLPTFATASPTEGVKTGPSGGDNIFLLRPLNEQTYEKALDFACKTMKMKKIGL